MNPFIELFFKRLILFILFVGKINLFFIFLVTINFFSNAKYLNIHLMIQKLGFILSLIILLNILLSNLFDRHINYS